MPGKNCSGAKTLLVSGRERRPIPRLPIKLDIRTDRSYKLVAIKRGFQTFEQPIEFEPGKAEKTFTIDLVREDGTAGAVAVQPRPHRGPIRRPPPRRPQPKPPAGMGTLNINSIPVSLVVLDGQPKGTTPKVGLKVPAGPHTVVFVHKEKGRKVVRVNVPAGGTKSAVVRF